MTMGADTQMKRLIKAAGKHLAKSSGDKSLADFAKTLFELGVEDEITGYDADGLAAIAATAREFAETKQPGRHKVRVFNPNETEQRLG